LRQKLRPVDRTILALAIPALGSLAADPLYSLADTAFVGHLGTRELGAVAVGSAAFTGSFWIFSFLAFGVTPRVARALGAEDKRLASSIGVQALILAVALGSLVTILGVIFAGPVVGILGAKDDVRSLAEPYLRIRVFSAAPLLLSLVGHGWLRGQQDTRTPMFIAVSGAVAHIGLDYLFIYPFGWGVQGAAWATLVAQSAIAAVFLFVLRRRMEGEVWMPDAVVMRMVLSIGGDLVIRSGALVGALTFATAVAARMGIVVLGSWQVAMQIYTFLALTVDSVAIAAQAMIGRSLGAARQDEAAETARRLMLWGIGLGVLLGIAVFTFRRPVAGIFTNDPRVIVASAGLIGWVALIQPLSAAAFTLDGILIGASDTRVLAGSMVMSSALFAGFVLVALNNGWQETGLAAGATIWLTARTATLGKRLIGGRWTTRS
jgi:putative MATE family efflux protein